MSVIENFIIEYDENNIATSAEMEVSISNLKGTFSAEMAGDDMILKINGEFFSTISNISGSCLPEERKEALYKAIANEVNETLNDIGSLKTVPETLEMYAYTCGEEGLFPQAKYNQYIDLSEISDSMMLNHGDTIAELITPEGYKAELEVAGDVCVTMLDENGEYITSYRSFREMPDELKEKIRDGSYLDDESIIVEESNWFALYYRDGIFENPDVEKCSPEQIYELMAEAVNDFEKENGFYEKCNVPEQLTDEIKNIQFETQNEAKENRFNSENLLASKSRGGNDFSEYTAIHEVKGEYYEIIHDNNYDQEEGKFVSSEFQTPIPKERAMEILKRWSELEPHINSVNSYRDINFSEKGQKLLKNSKTKNQIEVSDFLSDKEKMRDFKELTKEEFLASYSYLTEAEYDNTAREVAVEIANFYDEFTDEPAKPTVDLILEEMNENGVPATLVEYVEDVADWLDSFEGELSKKEIQAAEELIYFLDKKPKTASSVQYTNFAEAQQEVKEQAEIAGAAVFEIRNEYSTDEFPFEKEHLSIAFLETKSDEGTTQYAELIYSNDDDSKGFMIFGEFVPSHLQIADREGEIIAPPYLENVLLKDEDVLGKGAEEIYTMMSEFFDKYAEITLPTDMTAFLEQNGKVVDFPADEKRKLTEKEVKPKKKAEIERD